jgi:hypothetical protein
MTAITRLSVTKQIDEALDQVQKDRERVLAADPGAERSNRMADLYEIEARCWSVLFEHSRIRLHWRAALSAHEHARQSARRWRLDAAAQRSHDAGGRSRRGVA